VYHIPLAGGVAATTTTGALTLPSNGEPLATVHQALAFTGFAFGAYVVIALTLIILGTLLRIASSRARTSTRD
jgi:hypothetical protein